MPNTLPPPGLLVEGTPAQITNSFSVLAALQPVKWCDDGLACSPRTGDPDHVAAALEACPLAVRELAEPPGWPTTAALWRAGWYQRTRDHAPAPPAIRELIVNDAGGFGVVPHPTTTMCLELMHQLPAADAWDLGCGAGLLAQAWASLGRGHVHAVDIDAASVRHARSCVPGADITWHTGPVEQVVPELSGQLLLANLPMVAHRSIAAGLTGNAHHIILSGYRPRDADAVVELYAHLGCAITAEVRTTGTWQARLLQAR